MRNYKILSSSIFEIENFKIVPIRYDDRFIIMDWRNEQIEYLRQAKPLTEEEQEYYFSNTIASLFKEEKPEQLLFSFLENEELIGYGGLVHINWQDRHAEISFLLSPSYNIRSSYLKLFSVYLILIEKAATELCLNKIFTVGYNLKSYRFLPLIDQNYNLDATLKKHKVINGKSCDVLIYSKLL